MIKDELEYVKTLLRRHSDGGRRLYWRGWGFVEEYGFIEMYLPIRADNCGPKLTTYAWSGDGRYGVRKNPFTSDDDLTDNEWVAICLNATSLYGCVEPPEYPLDGVDGEIHKIEDLTAYLAALESFKASAV